ncbi:MAG: hypothetical protein JST30_08375 [Armatimonadetes bacterium]|nr:hypothetical protein [Armatimonadota bacterium]
MKVSPRTFAWAASLGLAACCAAGIRQHEASRDVREISLERTPCFGGCPVYTVTFKSDGTVHFSGKRYVDKTGEYEGKVAPEEVAKLAKALDTLGFWKLDKDYSEPITDQSHQYVRVTTDKGVRTVHRYGRKAPDELWMIETMIDGMLYNVRGLEKVPS